MEPPLIDLGKPSELWGLMMMRTVAVPALVAGLLAPALRQPDRRPDVSVPADGSTHHRKGCPDLVRPSC